MCQINLKLSSANTLILEPSEIVSYGKGLSKHILSPFEEKNRYKRCLAKRGVSNCKAKRSEE